MLGTLAASLFYRLFTAQLRTISLPYESLFRLGRDDKPRKDPLAVIGSHVFSADARRTLRRYYGCLISLLTLIGMLLVTNVGTAMSDALKDDTISTAPFSEAPSLDETPVAISTNGVKLVIPRNFLESAYLSRGDDGRQSVVLRVVMSFPTFTGASADTIRCFKPLSPKNCANIITVFILQSNENIKLRNGPAIDKAAAEPRDDQYGLTKVRVRISLDSSRDVFVYYGGSFAKSVVIDCLPESWKDQFGCLVRTEYFGRPILYHYSRHLLPHWRAINDGVVSALMSFHEGKIR